MGLFDFFKKDAGEKVEPPKQTAPEDVNWDEIRGLKIEKILRDNHLEVADLGVSVSGDRATVRGKVDSQEIREKVILSAGNVEGIAVVDDRLEVEKPEPEAQFYTVEPGDNLSKIAKQYYGDANKYPVIFEANKPMLSDPDKIYPGQVLRIPTQA